MRIVILGASGFLGCRFADSLARAGHEIIAVSRGVEPPHGAWTHYIQASIDDAVALESAFAGADYVLHLAWETTPGTSIRQPSLEATANLLPTMRLLEQLQRFSRCRLVFVSSGGALYRIADTPLAETSPLAPISCYGAAKASVEMMLRAYNAQTGHTVVILRPSNVYGPGQHAKRQFGIVPTLLRCARDALPFEIWGDGETVRDFLYITDLERLMSAVVAHDWASGTFDVFNAGSGRAVSINALCRAVEKTTGRDVRSRFQLARSIDARRVVLNSARAGELLQWTAATTLEQGLAESWGWFRHSS